jgi:hypothetical protein
MPKRVPTGSGTVTDHPSRETADSGQLIGDSGVTVEAGSQGGLLYVSNPARLEAALACL